MFPLLLEGDFFYLKLMSSEHERPFDFTSRNARAKVYGVPNQIDGNLALAPEILNQLTVVPESKHPETIKELNAKRQLNKELKRVKELKNEASLVLGESFEGKFLNYELWVERARYERVLAASDESNQEERIRSFRLEAELQLVTTLRERYGSEKSRIDYSITEANKLRSAIFPDSDFEDVLKRGIEYRKEEGSNDQEREQAELDGFLQIQQVLSDSHTEIGTKFISLSAPSKVKNSPYNKHFVDFWELKERGGERFVEMTRFATLLDEQGYKNSALKFDTNYFEEMDLETLPLDASFLSHPLLVREDKSAQELFDEYFEKDFKAMKEEAFQKIKEVCIPFIRYFIDELYKEKVNWEELAKDFNAILNIGDNFVKTGEKLQIPTLPIFPPSRHTEFIPVSNGFRNEFGMTSLELVSKPLIARLVSFWGVQEVRKVVGACGVSLGFKVKSKLNGGLSSNIESALENSVANFAFENIEGSGSVESDQYGSLEFPCGKCKRKNKRPYGQLLSNCQYKDCNASLAC